MKSFTLAAVACTPATGTLDSFARQPPQPDPMLRRLISTGERLWASLHAFLQLPGRPSQDTDSRVQLSALRIVLLSGITLEAGRFADFARQFAVDRARGFGPAQPAQAPPG